MAAPFEIVTLFDCDNTLLDHDHVVADLRNHLEQEFGALNRDRYFEIFEALRKELGYADYLGALQRYRLGANNDPRLLKLSCFLVDYPFASRLYPGSLEVIEHFGKLGPTVILSDGDVVFQPRKIQRSGLWDAVDGRVLIYIHKENMLDDVEQRYPARHYVMVDDKLRILAEMKKVWGNRLTTIFPRQGHYALDPQNIGNYPLAVGRGIVYDEAPRTERDVYYVEQKDKDNVAFLYVDERVDNKILKKPVGTCFFVSVWNRDHSIGHNYLVTAKHVWQWFRSRQGYVRVNKLEHTPGESGVEYKPLHGTWHHHSDATVDIAVLPWGDTEDLNYKLHSFDIEQIKPRKLWLDTENFRWEPREGAVVYYVGLLPQYHGVERNVPIVRTGHLALVTDELIEGAYGPSSYHLIDMQAYKLHSGGPVWFFWANVPLLLGVLVAADPVMQELLVRKTDVAEDDAETVAYYNLGVSFVAPTAKLIDILESGDMKAEREKAKPKPKKPVPLSADESEPLTKSEFEDMLKRVSQKVSEPESKDSETSE